MDGDDYWRNGNGDKEYNWGGATKHNTVIGLSNCNKIISKSILYGYCKVLILLG